MDDRQDDDEFSLSPEENRPTPQVFLENTPELDQKGGPGGRAKPSGAPSSSKPSRKPPRHRSQAARVVPTADLAQRQTAGGGAKGGPAEKRADRGEGAQKKACPNCRAALPSGATVCGTCGFHLILKRVISLDVNEDTLQETQGLDRWLRSMMEEGESLDSVFLLFHVLLAFVGVVLAVIFHPWGWLALGVAAAVYLTILYLGKISGSYHRWSLWGWDKLLGIYRRWGWRTLLPPFTPRVTLVRHDIEFTDEALEEMEDIFDYEVLDLEGSNISDRSLLHLAGCERLQFIVVRRTRVTRKGILRLQSMLPQVLIWS